MKTLKFPFLAFALLFAVVSCSRKTDDTSKKDSAGQGKTTFWLSEDLGVGAIDVYIDNVWEGSISHAHAAGISCGLGDVNYSGSKGVYSYEAVAANGAKWKGEFNLEDGKCKDVELRKSDMMPVNTLPSQYDNQGTVIVKSRNIQICLRDWDKVDGDVVKLIVNGKTVSAATELTGVNKCFSVKALDVGDNWMALEVISQGNDASAVSRVEIYDGQSTQDFAIVSTLSSSGGYIINVDPEE